MAIALNKYYGCLSFVKTDDNEWIDPTTFALYGAMSPILLTF